MTVEKSLRPTSPVHVHVDDDIPVHVHVKKTKSKKSKLVPKKRSSSSCGPAVRYSGSSNLKVTSGTSRARSRSPGGGPWIPPPGKTTRGSKLAWQGPSHRLELTTPSGHDAVNDMSTDEEDKIHGTVRKYEKKIDNLMSEVGSLKSESRVKHQHNDDTLQQKSSLDVAPHPSLRSQPHHSGQNIMDDSNFGQMSESDPSVSVELQPRSSTRLGDRKSRSKLIQISSSSSLLSPEKMLKDIEILVDLQKALHEIEKRDDLLNTSQRVIQQQDDELLNYQDELTATEKENRVLRQNVDILKGDLNSSRDADLFKAEQDHLMKKLIEVEMDGQAVAQQMRDLKDVLRRVKDGGQSEKLNKQKDLLLEKLADFDATNRILRRLLRDQHGQEAAALRLNEQRELLIRKLSDGDRVNERMRCELLDRERMMAELQDQVASQKTEISAMTNLQGTIETTRAHLQKQLRTKDSDCNRLHVQIRTLESSLAQNNIEMEHLQHLVNTAKERQDKDKEALKKATRAQKQRAERSEDALDKLNAQLSESDSQVIEYKTLLDQSQGRIEKLHKERHQAQSESSALKIRIEELENIVDKVEENSKSHVDTLKERLQEKIAEASTLKSENEKLKSSITSIENKFTQAEEDVIILRTNLKQYERLVDEYKEQMHRSRREADDSIVRLEEQKVETGRLQKDGQEELEKVKARLHQRLKELDPLPELLRSTETKLQEANERLLMYEIKNTESTKLITELSSKVEHTSDSQSSIKGKLHDKEDENRNLHSRLETLERKFRESEDQTRELMSSVSKREETIHQNNLRLEEKSRENASLTRQLENALSDNRRQNEEYKDRFNSKERTYQSRIVDLESQLSQLRTEIARIKREKEENERKFNSRFYDLKDRLEQCHSTNRSMQNYVHFLKSSYANVFGDNSVGIPPTSPIRSIVP